MTLSICKIDKTLHPGYDINHPGEWDYCPVIDSLIPPKGRAILWKAAPPGWKCPPTGFQLHRRSTFPSGNIFQHFNERQVGFYCFPDVFNLQH
jgi:hypothetical protein